MIPRLAQITARRIKAAVPDHPASYDVLLFSLLAVLNVAGIVILSLLISLFTDKLPETITALISFAVLRQLSGGLHLKSGDWCVIVSTLGIALVSFADFPRAIDMLLTAISFVLAILYAPSRIRNQTRIPERYYPLLKISACVLIALNFLIGSSVIAAAFFVQALTLIRGRR